jgi:hypothetical protein
MIMLYYKPYQIMIPARSIVSAVLILCLLSTVCVASSLHIVYAPGPKMKSGTEIGSYAKSEITATKNYQEAKSTAIKINSLREAGKDPGVQSSVFKSIDKAAYPNSKDGKIAHETKLKDFLSKIDRLSLRIDPLVKDSTWKDAREFGLATFRPPVDKIEVSISNLILGLLIWDGFYR